MRSETPVALILALALAAPALAENKPEKIAIAPDSEKAAIIMKAPWIDPPSDYSALSGYQLGISAFDPAEGQLKGSFFKGFRSLVSRRAFWRKGYLVSDIRPGTYAVMQFSRQDKWALCYHADTLQFTVRPGEVLYLGEFDARRHLAQLESMVIGSGQTSLNNIQVAHYFDGIERPAFGAVSESELAEVAAAMKTIMPRTTVSPTAVSFAPARFGTGSDAFGLQRVCGGYYRKGAGSTTPPPAPSAPVAGRE